MRETRCFLSLWLSFLLPRGGRAKESPELGDSSGRSQSEPRLPEGCLNPKVQGGPQMLTLVQIAPQPAWPRTRICPVFGFLAFALQQWCTFHKLQPNPGLREGCAFLPPPALTPQAGRQAGHWVWLPHRAHLSAALSATELWRDVGLF